MSNLRLVTDDHDFGSRLKGAGNDLVVVDFFTTWCGPCQKIAGEIISLAMKYPSVLFLKVDADICFETAMNHDLKGVPLFVLYRNMQILGRIQGAQPKLLDAKILSVEAEYYRNRVLAGEKSVEISPYIAKSNPATNDVGPMGLLNVNNYLEPEGCRVINDLSPSSFEAFLSGHKLTSGKGMGKLLLVYAFKEKMSLHSFRIKAKLENGPKVLRFFANHPKILDFNICSQLAPSQEVTLSADDLSGDRVIEFRAGAFNLVTNLQIYVADVMQTSWKAHGYHPIQFESFKLYGAPVIRKEDIPDTQHHRSQITPPKPYPSTPAPMTQKGQGQAQGQAQCQGQVCTKPMSEEPNPYNYVYSFVRESQSELRPGESADGAAGLTSVPSRTGPYAILFGSNTNTSIPSTTIPPHRNTGYPEPPSFPAPFPPKVTTNTATSTDVPTIQGIIAENLRNLRIETSKPTDDDVDSIPPGYFLHGANPNVNAHEAGSETSVGSKSSTQGFSVSPELKKLLSEKKKVQKAELTEVGKHKSKGEKVTPRSVSNNDSKWAAPTPPNPTRPTQASINRQSAKARERNKGGAVGGAAAVFGTGAKNVGGAKPGQKGYKGQQQQGQKGQQAAKGQKSKGTGKKT